MATLTATMPSALDDSLVNKRRGRKSHSFACGYADCGCFGVGELKCSQCCCVFHADCARKAKVVFLNGGQDEVMCAECAVESGVRAPDDLGEASNNYVQPSAGDMPVTDLQSLSASLHQGFRNIDCKLMDIGKKLLDFNTQVSNNRADIASIRTDVQALDSRIRAVEALTSALNMPSSSTSSSPGSLVNAAARTPAGQVNDLASELQDRMYRSNNVMLYNLQPSSDTTDVVLVQNALERIHNINVQAISTRRFTKPTRPNMPPPVIVRFSSREEVGRVLRNWKCLPDGLRVSPDHTKAQREQYNSLRREAALHNAAHPSDLRVVRFVNGVPTMQSQKN